jgi:hypothetical protein
LFVPAKREAAARRPETIQTALFMRAGSLGSSVESVADRGGAVDVCVTVDLFGGECGDVGAGDGDPMRSVP